MEAVSLDTTLRTLIQEIVRTEVAAALKGQHAIGEYLSTRAAAELAGVSQGTIRRWIRERRLVGYGAGRELRVRRDELEKLMETGRRASPVSEQPQGMDARIARELDVMSPRHRGAAKTPPRRRRAPDHTIP